jgi:preprotein translocase subunit SecY
MLQALRNAWRLPDVRNKILFTFFILLVYQFGTHIPVVGVDPVALDAVLNNEAAAGFLGVLNSAIRWALWLNFSVLANGVYPYITASIIFQLFDPDRTHNSKLSNANPVGRKKSNVIPISSAIPMAVLQSIGQISIFSSFGQCKRSSRFSGQDLLADR